MAFKFYSTALALCCVSVFCVSSATAGTIPFTSVTGAQSSGSGVVRGYRFRVLSEVTVTSLGAFDVASNGWSGNPSVFVGLWRDNGSLIASREVRPDSALNGTVFTDINGVTGQFRFESLASELLLSPGFYRVASNLADITGGEFFNTATPQGINPDIQILGHWANTSVANGFPNSFVSNSITLSGTILLKSTAVPEPSSLFACAISLGLVVWRKRRAAAKGCCL